MKLRFPAVLLLAAAALVIPAPAQAAACSGTSGVTVVVQFPDRTEIRCAAGNPSSGYQALQWAGYTLTYATGNGAGAICSIDQVPDHACPSMPPASAYWAYFHAKPGGSWAYSSTGGGGYDPKPGTVEGWRFGSGSAPSTAPPGSSSTPTPTPQPTTKPTSQPTARPTSGASKPVVEPDGTRQPSPGASTSAAAGSTPTPGATATASDASSAPTAAGTAEESVAAPTAVDTKTADSSSGGLSWIWGLVLVGVLATAAGTTAVRRRRG